MLALPPVAEFHDVDRARFENEIVRAGRPAVLRSLIADWPIVDAARTSDDALVAYLRERATDEAGEVWFSEPGIKGRFGFNAELNGFNFERKRATINQLLELLLRQRGSAEQWGIYAGALPLAKHAPRVLTDNVLPLLDADRYMLVSLWLGNRTKTSAHWDLPQNLACVVAGTRRFTLFPTDAVDHLYVGPLDFTLAGQPSSLADVDQPDFTVFPKLRKAYELAEVAELGPGDALYLPSLWWHAVTAQAEVGAMINYWWRDGPARTLSPQLSLMHALLTMQELPKRELEAWRAMFDHYVFRDCGDPAEHLPNHAKGVLGARSPKQVQQLTALLADALRSHR